MGQRLAVIPYDRLVGLYDATVGYQDSPINNMGLMNGAGVPLFARV
jgi:hypothetical protein